MEQAIEELVLKIDYLRNKEKGLRRRILLEEATEALKKYDKLKKEI